MAAIASIESFSLDFFNSKGQHMGMPPGVQMYTMVLRKLLHLQIGTEGQDAIIPSVELFRRTHAPAVIDTAQ